MAKLFLPSRQNRVCFSNPLNGRLWLNILEPHKRYGLLFKRGLNYPKRVLGFSFRSNEHGLRGPGNCGALGVVLGTSFGMGLSVDNESNWYELLLDSSKWFNGSMPVGPQNQLNLLDDLYRGPYDSLLYLYHPNIWKTAQGYAHAEKFTQDIFQTMGWKTDLWQTLALYPRWLVKELYKTRVGLSVHRQWDVKDFFFNAQYVYMDFAKNLDFAEEQMAILNRIFGRFKSVVAVRVPIKEDLAGRQRMSERLERLATNYDEWWSFFASRVVAHVRAVELPFEAFRPEDFHPYDTHWTVSGNERFTQLMRPLLIDAAVEGVKQQ